MSQERDVTSRFMYLESKPRFAFNAAAAWTGFINMHPNAQKHPCLLVFVHSDALEESLAAHVAEVSLLGFVHASHVHLKEPARAEDLAALFAHAGRALAVH